MKVQFLIPDFLRFLGRNDIKKHVWFRIDNSIFTDLEMIRMPRLTKLVWFYCVASASRAAHEEKGAFELDAENVSWLLSQDGTPTSPHDVLNSLDELIHKWKWMQIRDEVTWASVRDLYAPRTDLCATDRQTENNPTKNLDRTMVGDGESVRGEEPNEPRFQPEKTGAKMPNNFFMTLWNENCGNLPKVEKLDGARARNAKARWRENPDEAYWLRAMELVRQSPFCNGGGTRGWLATVDWLLKPGTATKLFEGQYDARKDQQGFFMTPAMQRAHNNRLMREQLERQLEGEHGQGSEREAVEAGDGETRE